MAEFDPLREGITGRQAYRLSIPGADAAAELSVISFTATEAMGEPTGVRIELTHPLQISRADFLNQDAVFSIVADDGTTRKFSGYIERFSVVQTTKDYVRYEIVLKSHFGRLAAVTTTQTYQHVTVPQILMAVLRRHGLRDHQVSFRLRRQYPVHAWRFQHQMTDLAYVQMLMQKEGIYSYIVETEYGDQTVFADDVDHYLYDEPQRIVPYREAAGLEAGGVEAGGRRGGHGTEDPRGDGATVVYRGRLQPGKRLGAIPG